MRRPLSVDVDDRPNAISDNAVAGICRATQKTIRGLKSKLEEKKDEIK